MYNVYDTYNMYLLSVIMHSVCQLIQSFPFLFPVPWSGSLQSYWVPMNREQCLYFVYIHSISWLGVIVYCQRRALAEQFLKYSDKLKNHQAFTLFFQFVLGVLVLWKKLDNHKWCEHGMPCKTPLWLFPRGLWHDEKLICKKNCEY